MFKKGMTGPEAAKRMTEIFRRKQNNVSQKEESTPTRRIKFSPKNLVGTISFNYKEEPFEYKKITRITRGLYR